MWLCHTVIPAFGPHSLTHSLKQTINPSLACGFSVKQIAPETKIDHGGVFSEGQTVVQYRATDSRQQTAECSFTVTVTGK
jgi:hypothetical protein